MNKKIIPIVFLVLLFLIGIIALTQELDVFFPGFNEEEPQGFFTEQALSPPRWFRSNAGGMALEEIASQLVALRNEYALAIAFAHYDELPEYLLPYYDENYLIETRMLYKNGEQIRTQWLFRNIEGVTRLNSVFLEPEISDEEEQADNIINRKGFIEIFDGRSFLTSEYSFLENGRINRIDYTFNDNLLINAAVSFRENNEEYIRSFSDFYRYNRTLSLRSIERVFYEDMETQHIDPVLVVFPRRVMDATNEEFVVSERFNVYPAFFGEIFAHADSRIIYETDERGRILSQTLFDEAGEILWVISNTWQGNRIVSTSKTEGGTVFLAEFEYNSGGDRILERNSRDGIIERLVRTEGNFEIEELYLNGVVVLRAVWEDGEKISETRVAN